MAKRPGRPSPAMIVAMIALFVSISGVGYAAATIGTNDIKNGAVTKKKLHKNAVTSRKIKTDAVGTKKVRDNSLTGDDIDESALGQVPLANQARNADTASEAESAGVANEAFSTRHTGGIAMPNSLASDPIATLSVPAGSYVINAKLTAENQSNMADSPDDSCTLRAGGDVDTTEFDVQAQDVPADNQETVPLQLAHRFDAAGVVELRCSDSGEGSVLAFFPRITASQVRAVTNVVF